MKRKLTALLAALCITAVLPVHAGAVDLPLTSRAAVLMEKTTGQMLFAQNEHEKLEPASVTKIMTLLLTMDAIDSGALAYDDVVTVSANAAGMGGSQVFLAEGEQITVEELLKCVCVSSGNDAAVALAGYCAGDVATFVEWMNQRAADLGMTRTHFSDPNGLGDAGHYASALDMAKLGRACLHNETIARIVATKSITLEGRALTNHNKLLSRLDGCVGLKTGYTKAAGRTLVSCAEQAGHRLVAVTLRDGDDWNDHEALYRWGFLLTGIQETLETRLLGALENGREVSP